MNIGEYIASGILEQYALGLTSEEESKEVEKHTRQYPELLAELHTLQDALLKYNAAFSHPPPHDLEQKILNNIPESPKALSPSPAPDKYKRSASMVSIALLLALATLVYLFLQNRKNRVALANVNAQLEQLRSDCEKIRDNNTKMTQYIAAVGNAGNEPVVMKGLEIAPNALAIVHLNQEDKLAYIEVKYLPPPPAGKQYQLWAIVNGKPTDMGVFTLETEENKLKTVPFIAQAQAFAVTLEDEGGSPVPTLDQMYLLGNV